MVAMETIEGRKLFAEIRYLNTLFWKNKVSDFPLKIPQFFYHYKSAMRAKKSAQTVIITDE